MAGYEEPDPLDGMPPTGPLRTAKRGPGGSAPLSMPRAGGALSLTGAMPTQSVISMMMTIEKLVGEVSKRIPGLANAAAPFIAQMRDLGAAGLADQTTGGPGATNPEVSAPPPGMSPGGAAAGGGGGLPIPPPPMT